MVYSYLGLSAPLDKFSSTLDSALISFRKQNGLTTPPLTAGGVFSNNLSETAKFASNAQMAIYTSADDVFRKSDIIFVFVPDSALRTLAASLRGHGIRDKIICHFSGGFDASVLDFDPMNTYVSIMRLSSEDGFGEVYIAEGYGDKLNEFVDSFKTLGINLTVISAKDKALLVAGLNMAYNMPVMISNVCRGLFDNALKSNPQIKDMLIDNKLKPDSLSKVVRSTKMLSNQKIAINSEKSGESGLLYGAFLALATSENVTNLNTKSEIKKIISQMINESLEEI